MLFQKVEIIDQRETSAASRWRSSRSILVLKLRALSMDLFHLFSSRRKRDRMDFRACCDASALKENCSDHDAVQYRADVLARHFYRATLYKSYIGVQHRGKQATARRTAPYRSEYLS